MATLFAGMTTTSAWADDTQSKVETASLWPTFPRQDQKLVSEIVGVSHFNEKRVKELVKAHPELVNVWWDWGFGDWESPLGAAAHTGQRSIAEFLLASGAKLDVFAAAMLGFTNVVKAMVAAQPGLQRTLGPHGITLLDHAKVGGKNAAETLAYLESLSDAGTGHKVAPLATDRQKVYLGEFFSKPANVKLICRHNRAQKLVVDIQRGEIQTGNRIIHHLGNDEFYTAGVPGIRLRFTIDKDKATAVTFRGQFPDHTLQRVGS